MTARGGAAGFEKTYFEALDCVKSEMTYNQLFAIVDKWMKDHPEEWHYDMSALAWTAIRSTCHPNK